MHYQLTCTVSIPFTTTADVVAHVRRNEALVERCGLPAKMPTKHGLFMAHCFKSLVDGIEHIALVKAPDDAGDEAPFSLSSRPALVRVHSECCTGDIFGSLHGRAVQSPARAYSRLRTLAPPPAAPGCPSPAAPPGCPLPGCPCARTWSAAPNAVRARRGRLGLRPLVRTSAPPYPHAPRAKP